MNPWIIAGAGAALALERMTYAIVWVQPARFVRCCRWIAPGRDPVDVLAWLFVAFKAIQVLVFIIWALVHGGTIAPASPDLSVLLGASVLILLGQALNLSVFATLGSRGVFYGNRLGHDVPWRDGFPFSVVRHPQYVGTVLTIWGVFFAMRYPEPDWLVLPILETVYYAAGALVEQAPSTPDVTPPSVHPSTTPDQPA